MRWLIVLMLLATCAGAVPVNPRDPDGVAAVIEWGGNPWVLNTNGEVWACGSNEWEHYPNLDIPIPITEVCDWDRQVLRDCQGRIWWLSDWAGGDWSLTYPLPWEPIQTEEKSLGDIKATFR